jgi:hypothetical protein
MHELQYPQSKRVLHPCINIHLKCSWLRAANTEVGMKLVAVFCGVVPEITRTRYITNELRLLQMPTIHLLAT